MSVRFSVGEMEQPEALTLQAVIQAVVALQPDPDQTDQMRLRLLGPYRQQVVAREEMVSVPATVMDPAGPIRAAAAAVPSGNPVLPDTGEMAATEKLSSRSLAQLMH
jgi:hypothetical protein